LAARWPPALAHNGGNGRIGFVAREDIAEALARVLTSAGHLHRTYPITVSRECYGLPEIAAALGHATGKDIKYQPLSTEEFRAALERASPPAPAVTMSVALGEAVRAGEFDLSHPALQTLLERPPLSLQDFLTRNLKT
jgi:NAD(P)H dehydrogenase (quinone)